MLNSLFPKLSLIIPVYNTENFLRECIESILHQKFQNFEIILIDDGSTDSSGEICEEYVAKDSRLQVYHILNNGQAAARNLGIDKAKGEYIGFVDSDDWIDSHMFEKLIGEANRTKCEIIACNFYIMDKEGKFSPYTKNPKNRIFSKDDAMLEIINNSILTFSPCNKIYKKELFREVRFNEGIIFEDMDISYRLIYKSSSVAYLEDALYYYRYNINSTLRAKFSLKRLDSLQVMQNMYDFYKVNCPKEALVVYTNLVMESISLYSQILIHYKTLLPSYGYLLEIDRRLIIASILRKWRYYSMDRIAKLLLIVISPKLYIGTRNVSLKIRLCFRRVVSCYPVIGNGNGGL